MGLLVVGAVAALIALSTLRDIRKQTSNTKTAADAALLNAKAIINAERAWVFAEIKKEGIESFTLRFTNHGKTPAEIIDIKQQEAWTDLTDPDKRELPVPPNYGLETKLIQPRILVPNGSFIYDTTTLSTVLPQEIYAELKTSKKRYFIYGRVQYRDLIDREKMHETGFCYFWSPVRDEFLIGGPSEYTYYT